MRFNPTPIGSSIPQFALFLYLGGQAKSLPIHSATISNSIVRSASLLPTAVVTVVSGIASDGGKTIDAAGVLSNVKRGDLARIIFSWEAGKGDVVFNGFVTGVSGYRSDSANGVAITMVHWLSLLEGSSAFFAGLDAQFPEDAMRWITAPSREGALFITERGLAGAVPSSPDVWGMFRNTLEYVAMRYSELSANNLGKVIAMNTSGFKALQLIQGKAKMIAGAEATDIMRTTFHTLAMSASDGGATLLQKVMTFCEMMGVMLLPGIAKAAIAPEGSMGSGKRGATLSIDEETLVHVLLARNLPVDGCYMYGALEGFGAGVFGAYNEKPVASFSVDQSRGGRVISATAPPWLRGFLQSPHATHAATGAGRGDAASGNPSGAAPGVSADNANKLISMADLWCKHKWAMASCAGSLVQVEGPLRFDIGPGTQIGLTTGTSHNSAVADVYGLVEGVQHRLNAGTSSVSTLFSISGSRMVADDVGLAEHPLYGEYLSLWEP